jgi:hypothetical protein
MFRFPGIALLIGLTSAIHTGLAQAPASATPPAQPAARPQGPAPRDPATPGYVKAKDLPDGTIPGPTEDGNFIIGPTHTHATAIPSGQ